MLLKTKWVKDSSEERQIQSLVQNGESRFRIQSSKTHMATSAAAAESEKVGHATHAPEAKHLKRNFAAE